MAMNRYMEEQGRQDEDGVGERGRAATREMSLEQRRGGRGRRRGRRRGRGPFRHARENILCPSHGVRRHVRPVDARMDMRVFAIPPGGRRNRKRRDRSKLSSSSAASTRFPQRGLLLVLLLQHSPSLMPVSAAGVPSCVAPDPDPSRSTALRFRLRLLRETPRYRVGIHRRVGKGDGEEKIRQATRVREGM
jgi:hypothetical protein